MYFPSLYISTSIWYSQVNVFTERWIEVKFGSNEVCLLPTYTLITSQKYFLVRLSFGLRTHLLSYFIETQEILTLNFFTLKFFKRHSFWLFNRIKHFFFSHIKSHISTPTIIFRVVELLKINTLNKILIKIQNKFQKDQKRKT